MDIDVKPLRIDLLLPPKKREGYGVLSRFTHDFAQALQEEGGEIRLLDVEALGRENFLSHLMEERPDCTLSFNGLLPNESGLFLADTLQLLHIAYIVDSPNFFFSLAASSYTKVISIDRYFQRLFQRLGCAEPLFLPHAAPSTLRTPPQEEPLYPIVFFGTLFDVERRMGRWKKERGKALFNVLSTAVDIAINDTKVNYYEAFCQSLDHSLQRGEIDDPRALPMSELLDEVESVLRGKERWELVKQLEGLPLHLFGGESDDRSWGDLLPHNSSIQYHGSISYEEAISVMKQSAIVLNSTPSIRDGSHERIVYGSLVGAVIVTGISSFLQQSFTEDELLIYRYAEWEPLYASIERVLRSPSERMERVERTQKKIVENHSWNQRAKVLLNHLPSLLHKVEFPKFSP